MRLKQTQIQKSNTNADMYGYSMSERHLLHIPFDTTVLYCKINEMKEQIR